MAPRVGALIVFSILLVMSVTTKAQTTSECSSSIVDLAPCLNFVSSDTTFPSAACCNVLKPVIASAPKCLCLLIGYGNESSTIVPSGFNQTRARELPGLCNVSAHEENCPALIAGTPTVPAASGPAPPPTSGSEGPSPANSSAPTWLSSVIVILSCTAVALFASLV